jgi:hypothetical protein
MMKTRRLLIGIIATATTTLGTSQNQIKYDVLQDNPHFFMHIRGGVVADIDFYDNNVRSGFYIVGNVNLSERIYVGGEIMWGTDKWNRVAREASTIVDKSMYDLHGRGSLFFSVKEERQDVKVTLKKDSWKSGGYQYTQETFINAPATTINKFGLTGSFGFYRNTFLDNFKRDTVYQLQEVGTSNLENIKNAATHFSGPRITAGFHISNVRNFVINAQNASTGEIYGKKGVRNKIDVMIEAMYMPLIAVNENFTTKPDLGGKGYTLSEKPDVRNIGYRLRIDSYTVSTIGLGFRFEFGSRPGIAFQTDNEGKLKNLYLTAGITLGFNK